MKRSSTRLAVLAVAAALIVVGVVVAVTRPNGGASRCEDASGAVASIRNGVDPGVVFAGQSAAVKSGTILRVRIAIVAAHFTVAGGPDQVGLWATDDDLSHPTYITALNDAAVAVSTWPDIRTARTSAVERVDESTDGVAEVLQCVR